MLMLEQWVLLIQSGGSAKIDGVWWCLGGYLLPLIRDESECLHDDQLVKCNRRQRWKEADKLQERSGQVARRGVGGGQE